MNIAPFGSPLVSWAAPLLGPAVGEAGRRPDRPRQGPFAECACAPHHLMPECTFLGGSPRVYLTLPTQVHCPLTPLEQEGNGAPLPGLNTPSLHTVGPLASY